MLVPKKMKSSKIIILIIVTVLIIGVISYLLYTNVFFRRITPPRSLGLTPSVSITPLFDSKLEVDFLKKSPYIDLTQFGILPVKVEKTGRKNPFLEIIFFLPESLESLE